MKVAVLGATLTGGWGCIEEQLCFLYKRLGDGS